MKKKAAPSRYRIHPAIGIARVGDADDRGQFFIGPEIPGVPALPGGGRWKTAERQVRPQAARFRVWEYRESGGKFAPFRELTLDEPDVAAIRWTVHLANRKGSFHRFEGLAGESRPPAALRNLGVADRASLEIDPGARTVAGRSQSGVTFTPGTSADPGAEKWPLDPRGRPAIDYLGELRTDEAGRLLVIGGKGRAASTSAAPPHLGAADDDYAFANNDSWLDDVGDGPVAATIELRSGASILVDGAGGAWAMVGPPDFAPQLGNVVTLYDVLYDQAARSLTLPTDDARYDRRPLSRLRDLNAELRGRSPIALERYRPSFADEIYPILRRAIDSVWTFSALRGQHVTIGGTPDPKTMQQLGDPSTAWAAKYVFQFMRAPVGMDPPPEQITQPAKRMPKLYGDAYDRLPDDPLAVLSVTPTQFALLRRWSEGEFEGATLPLPPPPQTITPEGLDRAALESCVGGALFPGIEVSWQIRAPSLFGEPFRIDHGARSAYLGESAPLAPGHFTRQMSVPWHADFFDCAGDDQSIPGEAYGWWPGQRPDAVYPEGTVFSEVPPPADLAPKMVSWTRGIHSPDEMATGWSRLGFVARRDTSSGTIFVEVERNP